MSQRKKPKSPKFKFTKELLTIANNDGMTQEEIAKLCRVTQSVVSGWMNGKSKAREHQLQELLKRYGARLNRTSSRLYLAAEPYSFEKLTESELGRACLQAQGEDEALLPKHVTKALACDIGVFSIDELRAFLMDVRLVRIEGPIIFRYSFTRPELISTRDRLDIKRRQVGRWLLHHQSRDRFVLVRQVRRILLAEAAKRWRQIVTHGDHDVANALAKAGRWGCIWLDSREDAARWLSRIDGPMNAEQLLKFVDAYLVDEKTRHSPHDEQVLPFLIRKTLIELGYHVPDVLTISSYDAVE